MNRRSFLAAIPAAAVVVPVLVKADSPAVHSARYVPSAAYREIEAIRRLMKKSAGIKDVDYGRVPYRAGRSGLAILGGTK